MSASGMGIISIHQLSSVGPKKDRRGRGMEKNCNLQYIFLFYLKTIKIIITMDGLSCFVHLLFFKTKQDSLWRRQLDTELTELRHGLESSVGLEAAGRHVFTTITSRTDTCAYLSSLQLMVHVNNPPKKHNNPVDQEMRSWLPLYLIFLAWECSVLPRTLRC